MGGFDRMRTRMLLEKYGWVEDPNDTRKIVPPADLLEKAKTKSFDPYEARELQCLISDMSEEEAEALYS